jgi:hypothetical protein|tara:strand:+ start:590 stop:1885 length:1296 start_codon:yes stop_codon:yes gene_type:complete
MKTLQQIREASGGKEAYQKFFNILLKKFGVKSPSELEGDKKKQFYDAIDKGWDGDNEKAESVQEASKLKAGKGKITVDLNWDASDADAKRHEKKYKIKLKITRTGALATGEKKNVLAYIVSDDYGMDDEDIEDLMPELMETYDDEDNLDPETTNNADEDQADTAVSQVTEKLKAGRGKLSRGAAIDIDYMGDRKDIKFDSTKWKINMVGKGDGMLNVYGDKQKIIAYLSSDDYGMDDEDIEDLFPELLENHFPKHLSVIRNIGEAIKKSYPVMDQGQRDKIVKIAKANSGNMAKAIKLIDKIKKGLSDNPDVMDLLKKANESVDEAIQNESVSVDRRTAGFKEALKRQESAKKKREAAKLLKDEKKQQAELDSRYDYDGGVDTVLAAANAAMFGTKLPEDSAANNAGDGNVDMAPDAGKKKKKEILARRGY